MSLKKFLARFVGLIVADVVSAAKIRFAPGAGESFYGTSNIRGHNGYNKIEKTAIPIRPMVWRIFLFHLNSKRNYGNNQNNK